MFFPSHNALFRAFNRDTKVPQPSGWYHSHLAQRKRVQVNVTTHVPDSYTCLVQVLRDTPNFPRFFSRMYIRSALEHHHPSVGALIPAAV